MVVKKPIDYETTLSLTRMAMSTVRLVLVTVWE
jgi:hypothetical protein